MWIVPKTDWTAESYFNATDYNRIKNNLEHLKDFANRMYEDFELIDMGDDKTYSDYFYADEINLIEDNLEKINKLTFDQKYGEKPVYRDNESTMTFEELNRIERAILDLNKKLTNQSEGMRRLSFHLGKRGGDL